MNDTSEEITVCGECQVERKYPETFRMRIDTCIHCGVSTRLCSVHERVCKKEETWTLTDYLLFRGMILLILFVLISYFYKQLMPH